MALNDFTGQNIQNTYQKVVQTEGNLFADGTGSALSIITANQTSSMTVATASYAISASVEITHEVSSSYAQTASMAANNFIVQGHITSSGNISSSGNLFVSHSLTFADSVSPARINFSSSLRIGNPGENDFIEIVDESIRFNTSNGTAVVINDHTNKILLGYGGGIDTVSIGAHDIVAVKHVFGTLNEPQHQQFGQTLMGSGSKIDLTSTATLHLTGSGHNDYTGIALDVRGDSEFIGHITASGNISSSGTITATINGGSF